MCQCMNCGKPCKSEDGRDSFCSPECEADDKKEEANHIKIEKKSAEESFLERRRK